MVLLAYGSAVVIAILAATVVSGWIRADGPERVVRTRILAGIVTATYTLVVVGVVAFARDGASMSAWAIAAMAVTGAVLYGAGLLRWSGSAAWVLRLAGWALMIGAAAIPSHLTLLLPLPATLAVILYPVRPTDATGSTTGDGPATAGTDTDVETP